MNEEELLGLLRQRVNAPPAGSYTAKDFQLEVLGKLTEMQETTEFLAESWRKELKAIKEPGPLAKFDSRTLVALAAIALSITGYVIQDARNISRQDAEIETAKARIASLEQLTAANTEARVRNEVELKALQEGQGEIKQLLMRHERETSSLLGRKK